MAEELFSKGVEPVEIIETLQKNGSVSSATVYRWLNEFRLDKKDTPDEGEKDLDVENDSKDLEETNETESTADSVEVRKKKRTVLKSARRLLRELLELPDTHKWNKDEASKALDQFEEIQGQIEDALDYDTDEFKDNLMWNVLTDYVNKMELVKRSFKEPKVEIIHSDLFPLREKILIEIALDVEDFDEPYYMGIELMVEVKVYLHQILQLEGKKIDEQTCKDMVSQLDKITLFASQNGLDDDFKADLEVLKKLRKSLSELQIRCESGKNKVILSSELKERLLPLAETSFLVTMAKESSFWD